MSEEKKHKPVINEDGEDTEQIVDEKDPSKETTGERQDYQHVVDPSTGQRTGKVITPDGRVLTEQPTVEPRPVDPMLANPGGGLSVHFPDIKIEVGDIHAPDLNITEPLLNVDIPRPLIDVDIPQPLMQVDIPEPLVDIDISKPLVDVDAPDVSVDIDIPDITMPEKIVEIVGPLVPEFPEMPEKIVEIVGPLVPDFPEWPEIPEWPTIPENLVNIVGPMVEVPEDVVNIVGPMVELPEWPEEGLVNVGDITMPEVVGIDVPLEEIPETVQYGFAGGAILLGLGVLLLGIGRTASAVKGITKAVTGR